MLRYMRFDSNITSFKRKYKMVLLFSIILILIILMYNIIINNHSNNEIKIISKNSRRIISNLDNYTETMSEFIVNNNNYNPISNNDILNSINEIQKDLKGFKEKELKIQIKKNAIEFLENNYGIKPYIYNLDFFINYNTCIKQLLNLDIDLFSLLLNIDYENLTVSFNYFNENKDYNNYKTRSINNNYYFSPIMVQEYIYDTNNYYYDNPNPPNNYRAIFNRYTLLSNYYENIINNPIYNIIKDKLKFAYDYKYSFEYYNNLMNYYKNNLNSPYEFNNINNISYIYDSNYYIEYISNNIVVNNNIQYNNNYPNPYEEICNFKTIKNSYVCADTSSYNYYTKEITIYSINCNIETTIEYENDKLNRHSYLPKPYNQISSVYYNEIYELYNEYEYIKQLINLEEIPIIHPIKF